MPVGTSDTLAIALTTSLTTGKSFTVPSVDLDNPLLNQPPATGDLYAPVDPVTVADLTTGTVNGTGAFDQLMKSITAHLKVEFEAGRIAGAEYTKAYQAMVGVALQTAAQFVMGKDQAYWGAVMAQQQVKTAVVEESTARVNLEIGRTKLAQGQIEVNIAEANYALTKLKLSTEDATITNLGKQADLLTIQHAGVVLDNAGKTYTNANILPQQLLLLTEQSNVQRAQTADLRADGGAVLGVLGKQKDLYTQQIKSYQDDAATKVAKFFNDAFITQKTLDETTTVPNALTSTNVSEVMVSLRTKVGL